MAGLACWHPLAAIPEDGLVSTVRRGVMHDGGRCPATMAKGVLGEETDTGGIPLAVISTGTGRWSLSVKPGVPRTVGGIHIRALLA